MKKLLIVIELFSFFIGSILWIIFYNSFKLSFYENFYKEYNLASAINTTDTELIANTKNLLSYLEGKEELNSAWFTTKDIQHMVDVKSLYDLSHSIMLASFIIFLLTTIILVFLLRKETLKYITKMFNKVVAFFVIVVTLILIAVWSNFNSFWIKFHTVLFSNDLWLLSPSESNLIKMVPEEFFTSLVMKIIIHVFLLFVVLIVANVVVRKKLRKFSLKQ